MSSETVIGLRERKRAETRAQLERAAVAIALRDGVDGATIDAISAEANVSPRTFFNYFDSKEDAIMGVRDPQLDPDRVAAFATARAGQPTLEAVVGVFFDVYETMAPDFALHKDRKAIMHSNPAVISRQMEHMSRVSELLVAAVGNVLDTEDPEIAEVALGIASSAFRVAFKQWMTSDGGTPGRRTLEKRAVELARKTIGTLS
jgi:AcrR family transcriptional regulator